MDEVLSRFLEDLSGRVSGPMWFRLLLQPAMAMLFAIKDGLLDAREGHPAYFWALVTDAGHRRQMLKDGWKSIAKVFVIAVVLDAVYQYLALQWFYPGEALLVACLLALVPYLLVRGPINVVMRARRHTPGRSG
jgi:peptidoglycan/LPS O-acetylase OafA/YrhL